MRNKGKKEKESLFIRRHEQHPLRVFLSLKVLAKERQLLPLRSIPFRRGITRSIRSARNEKKKKLHKLHSGAIEMRNRPFRFPFKFPLKPRHSTLSRLKNIIDFPYLALIIE